MVGNSKVTKLAVSAKKTAQTLALSTSFLSGVNITIFGATLYLHYFLLLISIIILALSSRKLYIEKKIYITFLAVILISLAYTLLSNNKLIQQDPFNHYVASASKTIATLIIAQCFLSVFFSFHKSIESLFHQYLKVSTFFCYLAIFQELIYVATRINIPKILGLTYKDYGFYIGVPSLSVEPAFFACAALPSACYWLLRAIKAGKPSINAFVTTSAILFSTSSLGILGLIICILFSFLGKNKSPIKLLLATPILATTLYTTISSEFFQLRLIDTIELLSSRNLEAKQGLNLSTYSIGINTSITKDSILANNGLGVGFGQYSSAFDNHIVNYEIPIYRDTVPGRGSATSFGLRIITELGILGGLAIIFFTIRSCHMFGNSELHLINIACISTLLIIYLRMGEYFSNGVIFVILIIYFSHKKLLHIKSPLKQAHPSLSPNQPFFTHD